MSDIWTLCSDKMPNLNESVLITYQRKGNENIDYRCMAISMLHERFQNGKVVECCWVEPLENFDDFEVVAWMSLPSIYKGNI